jgi:hypothetical protein
MGRIRQNWKFGAVAASCLVIGAGAGASMIGSAGATTTSSSGATGTTATHAHHGLRARRLLGRTVHGDLVLATKHGFVTVTVDRGRVQSVNGQQLTLTEGTKTQTYKTVTLKIPTDAKVRDNKQLVSLADVKAGQRAIVVQGPQHTWVIARG